MLRTTLNQLYYLPYRFRPSHRGNAPMKFAIEEGRFLDVQPNRWMYQRRPMDRKPILKEPKNPFYTRRRLWNVIPSAAGVVARKVHEWGYPHRDPPPTGIRQSREYLPYFMDKYFPDVTCTLVLDSVLNNETAAPKFIFPCEMSKDEIANYLRNVYGFENIVGISTRNVTGRRWKNEIGFIRQAPQHKVATVLLDAPVKIDFKQVKGTEDGTA